MYMHDGYKHISDTNLFELTEANAAWMPGQLETVSTAVPVVRIIILLC